jgi:hypothetical protein
MSTCNKCETWLGKVRGDFVVAAPAQLLEKEDRVHPQAEVQTASTTIAPAKIPQCGQVAEFELLGEEIPSVPTTTIRTTASQ